jgi:hypothetical protein
MKEVSRILVLILSLSAFCSSLFAGPISPRKLVGKPISKTALLSNDPTILAETQSKEVELNAVDLCLCGAFATAFGDFAVHPIDTIKITQQTAGKYFESWELKYS